MTPEALPAVTRAVRRETASQLRERLERVSRGCSSRSTTIGSPFFAAAIVTGHDLVREEAAPLRRALRAADCAAQMRPGLARDTLNSAATFSAVSGIESTPYCSFISGLTKRQPIVVSYDLRVARETALSALDMTKGARVMLSTPPAIISSASPDLIARAAVADRVEARSAQPVDRRAGHLDRQARRAARHARDVAVVLARLVGAAVDHVVDRRPVDAGVALISALIGNAARSSVRTDDSAPP